MNEKLDKQLCFKYPKIFADRYSPIEETCMCWGFSCDDGWYWLIDNLCNCIQAYMDANGERNNISQPVATQVKEKYGSLRFYYIGGDEMTDGMVWFAEFLSYTICESCGSTKSVTQNTHGYISTLCNNCRKKYLKKEIYGSIRWLLWDKWKYEILKLIKRIRRKK